VRAGGRRTDATLVAPTLAPIEPSDLDGARFCSPDVNPETREVPMGTHSTLEVLRVSLVAAWLIAGAAPSPAGAGTDLGEVCFRATGFNDTFRAQLTLGSGGADRECQPPAGPGCAAAPTGQSGRQLTAPEMGRHTSDD